MVGKAVRIYQIRHRRVNVRSWAEAAVLRATSPQGIELWGADHGGAFHASMQVTASPTDHQLSW
jgi:hypothetical protein